ncbi:ribokinase [Microbacteriaceae bacterium SG_E_30_P1]|uniref:Ribokinase n=1 Tax=Antiquaquibacter oligotrophicus TaxID=2880260 RepID=A0ABT6KQ50_9MICO|nr:ribokinase [Antiquaquibacter oligotrophicus]MDH6182099.1 ribokinase [Antiquaquibacter oligotrophicus]UDF12236.1 ribokinase [Antiquaquibacter oligotrophicus]
MSTSNILVLGSANLDVVVRMPRLPSPGETVFGSTVTEVPGGKGLNQAVAAARAGGRVAFSGAVGDDPFGRVLERALVEEGIDTTALETTSTPTGTARISVDESGENSIVVVPGANADVAMDEHHEHVVGAADFLVMQLETPIETVRRAALVATRVGAFVVLTPAPVHELDDEFLSSVDLLVANEHEAAALAGGSDPQESAQRLSARTGKAVIVTLGSAGCLLSSAGGDARRFPARPVAAVDTTAAGDTFVGALVAHLAGGGSMEEAIERGTAAASIAVTRPGATSSMPTREEIDAALAASNTEKEPA